MESSTSYKSFHIALENEDNSFSQAKAFLGCLKNDNDIGEKDKELLQNLDEPMDMVDGCMGQNNLIKLWEEICTEYFNVEAYQEKYRPIIINLLKEFSNMIGISQNPNNGIATQVMKILIFALLKALKFFLL